MITLVSGDEYLCDKYIKKEKEKISDSINVLFAEEWGEDEELFCRSYPFMEDAKLCVLDLKELRAGAGTNSLTAYVKNPSPDTKLIIKLKSIDGRMEIIKCLKNMDAIKEYEKLGVDGAYAFMKYRLVMKYKIPEEQVDRYRKNLYSRLSGYEADESYDMYRVMKYTDMLGRNGELSAESINFFMPETILQKSYKLSDMLFKGEVKKMLELARGLMEKGEQPINLLSLILSQVRICYKASLYPEMNRKEILEMLGIRSIQLNEAYSKFPQNTWAKVYAAIQGGVNELKNGKDTDSTVAMALIKAAECMGGIRRKAGCD